MNFRDRGIIISKRELKERSNIITIFSQNSGIYSGVSKQFTLSKIHYINTFFNQL